MPWLLAERRREGVPERKQRHGWGDQTISSSLTLPPPHFVAVFAIVILLLSTSWYADYKAQVHRARVGFRFVLFLLPAVLILVVRYAVKDGRLLLRLPRRPEQDAGSSPWGVLVLVLALLLMVSYHSYLQWYRPL